MATPVRHAVGSLLVVGLSGVELTGLERAWLRTVRPGGIILFRRNIADAAQTRSLLDAATRSCAPHAYRCVDVEGGTVDRLRDALAPMPSAQAAAQAGKGRMHGELVGRAVRAFGFNTTLAPVLDLALPESATVMGTRAAAPKPEGVARYAGDFLDGLAAQGVTGCGKHFPGLGSGTLDSHLDTPSIERKLAALWANDIAPYRALRDSLPMVMINHAAYPATPSGRSPASVSRYWIETVLRKRIGYKGIVFSDDLEMGGVLRYAAIEEAALRAIHAGADLIEICHSPELILRAFEALLAEAERSRAFAQMIAKRAQRLRRFRNRCFASGAGKALTAGQFEALRVRIQKFAEALQK